MYFCKIVRINMNLKSTFYFTVAFAFFLLINKQSFAQHGHCGTDHFLEEWRKTTPNWEELERIDPNAPQIERRNGKRIIPVVFHVLHTNGQENISNEQIMDQLRILNEDFNKLNPDVINVRNTTSAPFAPLVTDMQIEFVLARKDPQGSCTNGINRIFTPLHAEANDAVKNVIRWPVNRYLNIWVVSTINTGSTSEGTVLGYANFPFMSASTDGIVIRSDEVGSIGTGNRSRAGRTLTHEIGHYLGLFHTFQGGCTGAGDSVNDTPPVASTFVNANCPQNGNSCPSNPLHDQWENYMDYSLGCQYMFTHGQKSRVDNFLTRTDYTRRNLYSAENLLFTGITFPSNEKPVAFFESSARVICAGSAVKFFDNSCMGEVTSRTWNFEGANILSSSQPSPSVVYQTPGLYSVKLTVNNINGSSTYEQTQYIQVLPAVAPRSGLAESFENTSVFSVEGISQITGPGFGSFEKVSKGYFGSTGLKANITTTNTGTRYIIETPSLNISLMSGQDPKLSFMVAYARRNTTNTDLLRIYVSEDCGNTWTQRVQRVGAQFASVQGFVSGFEPQNSSDWTRIVFNLFEYVQSTNLKIRIEFESGGGNPVFIDDINISQYFTSVHPVEKWLTTEISPNPGSDVFFIRLSLDNKEQQSVDRVEIIDLNGKKVAQILDEKRYDKNIELRFSPIENGLSSGLYFVKIHTNEGVLTKKLIFAN